MLFHSCPTEENSKGTEATVPFSLGCTSHGRPRAVTLKTLQIRESRLPSFLIQPGNASPDKEKIRAGRVCTAVQSTRPTVNVTIIDGDLAVNMIRPNRETTCTFEDYVLKSFLPYVEAQVRLVD